nr:aldolase [Kocuria rhizophila]
MARADLLLAGTDADLARFLPGDSGTRQPVHTCYVPADLVTERTPAEWGAAAALAAEEAGGLAALAGVDDAAAPDLVQRVARKLREEPVEDLRLDLEDGYGERPDAEEDADAVRAAHTVAAFARNRASGEAPAPAFAGIRFKCFEAATRARGLRTLDLFLSTLVREGGLTEAGISEDGLPEGLVLTLPKVSAVEQVAVMVEACEAFEDALGLPAGRLRFEIQMETPAMILGPDGTCPIPAMLCTAEGRVSALHYGTYDYSASLGISGQFQSLEHPAADHAKNVIQVAVAGTGVRLSDGSTNRLPVGDPAQRRETWALHSRLVRRSLERGFYQGWDLHAHQLPTRFLTNYAFYRDAFDDAARRLVAYAGRSVPGIETADVADEPATARALARYVVRGLLCGAVGEDELRATGLDPETVRAVANPGAAASSASVTGAPGETGETA